MGYTPKKKPEACGDSCCDANHSTTKSNNGHRRRRRTSDYSSTEEDETDSPISVPSGSELSDDQRKIRRRRKRKELRNKYSKQKGGSIVWTLLLIGLLFSLLTNVYIMGFLERRAFTNEVKTDDALNVKEEEQREKEYPVKIGTAQDNEKIMDLIKKTRVDLDHVKIDTPHAANDQINNNKDLVAGKEKIIDLITRAGVHLDPVEDEELIRDLPLWSDVVNLYGDKPVIHGLEQCQVFQNHSDRADHFVSTAGTFNTGTNLMAELLIANCHMQDRMNKFGNKNRGVRWQVPWGKHTPPGNEEFRINHKTYTDTDIPAHNILPAVTVRDPLFWLKSMCKHQYTARWYRTEDHCPNFSDLEDIATHVQHYRVSGQTLEVKGFGAAVQYNGFGKHHDSIVGLWNDYYNEYLSADFSRLIVRFEDLLFHPEEVTKAVCECAGGSMSKSGRFTYVVDSAKKGDGAHGKKRTGYVDALVKYGMEVKRYQGYQNQKDLEFIRDNLDQNLMELMSYPSVDPEKLQPQDTKIKR